MGPKMERALNFIALCPGCSKAQVARGIDGNWQKRRLSSGYAVVDRCIKAGYVRAVKDYRGRYRLSLTPTGWDAEGPAARRRRLREEAMG